MKESDVAIVTLAPVDVGEQEIAQAAARLSEVASTSEEMRMLSGFLKGFDFSQVMR